MADLPLLPFFAKVKSPEGWKPDFLQSMRHPKALGGQEAGCGGTPHNLENLHAMVKFLRTNSMFIYIVFVELEEYHAMWFMLHRWNIINAAKMTWIAFNQEAIEDLSPTMCHGENLDISIWSIWMDDDGWWWMVIHKVQDSHRWMTIHHTISWR